MGTRSLIRTLLLSTGLMAGACAWADDSKELKDVQGQIASQQQNLKQQQDQLKRLQQQLAKDEKAISALASRLNDTRNRLSASQAELAQLNRRHQELGQQAERQQSLLAEQLRAAYQSGRHDYLKLLLNGQDSADIDRLLHYYSHLNQVRVRALHELAHTRQQLAENRRQAEHTQAELNRLLSRQQQEQDHLGKTQDERSKTAKALNAALAKGNLQLSSLQQAARQLEQKIREAREKAAREQAAREKAAREQAERERAARNQDYQDEAGTRRPPPVVVAPSGDFSGLRAVKGKLPWPLNGQLIHRYGSPRTSQLTWKGLLIGTPVGQQVRAIASGQVLYADWLSGFGMVMIIDHGQGYMSLYGHNQSLLLQAGDKVSAGQPIALSGESGGQSRSGLYFEIRHQGQAIDPLAWLARR
ncbi:murein hydrolase activator EnvC [Zobellella maritima]|uniref:murein hydrolase activator EnvC n=1 Tax=Zobellella maritima TaxID=2059725 RepID=UPI000E309728|nr:murein hydrolase activator EnvC [Zobellella maritima]